MRGLKKSLSAPYVMKIREIGYNTEFKAVSFFKKPRLREEHIAVGENAQ
jgi:hypothetical protein